MAQEYNLLQSFEARGHWWLPEHPDHFVAGTLSFDPNNGPILSIDGPLAPTSSPVERFRTYKTIFGHLLNGPICTLVTNTTKGRTVRPGVGVVAERLAGDYLLLKVHLDNFSQYKSSMASVQFTDLEWWVGNPPMFHSITTDDGIQGSLVYKFHTTPFKSHIEIRDFNCRIVQLVTEQLDNHFASIKVEDQLVVIPTIPQVFEWYWQLIGDMRNLLVLFMAFPIYATKVFMEDSRATDDALFEVYFAQPYMVSSANNIFVHLFEFKEIKKDFSAILEKWIGLADRVRPVHDLFFGYIYRPDVFITFRFLALMQALETYHRSLGKGYFVSPEKYEEYLKATLAALPNEMENDLRQSLGTRLKYGNEYSLFRRLKELFKGLSRDGQRLIASDWKQFCADIRDYRNYLTHYDQETKPINYSEDQLKQICRQLQSLLLLLLLKEIGINEDRIVAAITKHPGLWPPKKQ